MKRTEFLDGKVTLFGGDNRDVLKTLLDNSIDAVVTDPPYALVSITKRFGKEGAAAVKVPEGGTGAYARASAGFMGQNWDTGETAFAEEFWREVYRVLKPGGYVLAFGGTRTFHRLPCAIEDAGFEIRDMIMWLYGSGFPKSHDISKAIDKAAGAERKVVDNSPFAARKPNGSAGVNSVGLSRTPGALITAPATDAARQWDGWGTALKPAVEPICMARKPLIGTVAANVLEWGTGGINLDGCRVGTDEECRRNSRGGDNGLSGSATFRIRERFASEMPKTNGRHPANLIHDGSDEVLAGFPGIAEDSAARFFWSPKADSDDRIGSKHPTVKPVDLMQYLCRLVTPPGGTVLDPFAGTGTTGEAAFREGFRAILIEREEQYQADIAERMRLVMAGPDEKRREIIKRKGIATDAGPLFEGAAE